MKKNEINGQNSVATSAIEQQVENFRNVLKLIVDSETRISKEAYNGYTKMYHSLMADGLCEMSFKTQVEITNLLAKIKIAENSTQEEKGYIQVITKNNDKLVDFVEKNYQSVEQMNDDYKDFVKHYTKLYMMHTNDDNIKISFSECAVELDVANDWSVWSLRNHKARKMHYGVNGYSVDVYKIEFVED